MNVSYYKTLADNGISLGLPLLQPVPPPSADDIQKCIDIGHPIRPANRLIVVMQGVLYTALQDWFGRWSWGQSMGSVHWPEHDELSEVNYRIMRENILQSIAEGVRAKHSRGWWPIWGDRQSGVRAVIPVPSSKLSSPDVPADVRERV